MHHKGRNKHHYEYWTDIRPGKTEYEAVPMPIRYMVESVMDRIAACKIYRGKDYRDGDALDYLLRVPERLHMHPDTLRQLVFLLTVLRDHGEAVLYRLIRRAVLRGVPESEWEGKVKEYL